MKRFLLLALAAGSLAACTVHEYKPERSSSSSSAMEQTLQPVASSSSSSEQWKEVTLADQTFDRAIGTNGMDWLKAIGTVKVQGHLDAAELVVQLSRGPEDDGRGWSAIGAYFAPIAASTDKDGNVLFTYPDESKYGTRLHFIDAEWRGDCHRHVAPSSSFGVLKEHSNNTSLDFAAVPMTRDDEGCETGQKTVNLLSIVNDTGLIIGFMPSDGRYYGNVKLRYKGNVTVEPL